MLHPHLERLLTAATTKARREEKELIALLTGSASVPYAAPVLCTLLRPGMTEMSATMAQHPTVLTTSDHSGTACDYAPRAVAPVANGALASSLAPLENVELPVTAHRSIKHFLQLPTPPRIA